jgi:hypothetical protein
MHCDCGGLDSSSDSNDWVRLRVGTTKRSMAANVWRVAMQKCAPSLRLGDPVARPCIGYPRLSDLKAELKQLAMNTRRSHGGFSMLIARIRARRSGSIRGRPPVDRDFERQYRPADPSDERLWTRLHAVPMSDKYLIFRRTKLPLEMQIAFDTFALGSRSLPVKW